MEPLNCQEVNYEINDISNETGIIGASSIKLNLPSITDDEFPTVSIVVPTYNRQIFYSLIKRNWEVIDYPKDKIEMIILDDSTDYITNDVDIFYDDSRIRYIKYNEKLTIGQKRNMLCHLANNEYIVHMDDDDWYPKESVASRIRLLLEFQKNMNQLCCVGCSKVLCFDLINNSMFEAYDESIVNGIPATISESTMAYSKKYWMQQTWNNLSVYGECLPFIKGRENTVCTLPSIFVITQFTHSLKNIKNIGHNPNTIERRIKNNNSVSEYNSLRFQESFTAYDENIFNKIRANIVRKLPEYREVIGIVQRLGSLTQDQIKNKIKKINNDENKRKLLCNPLMIDFMRSKLISKTYTSGKDIVYYCGPGNHLKFSNSWNPNSKILGGSEEAVINLTEKLYKLGYNVTVYCVLQGKSRIYNGVMYKNYWEWIPGDFQDITIIWRDPSNCKYVMGSSKKVLLDLHDAIDPNWLKGLHESIKVMVKSNYHKKILEYPSAYVIPNGITPIKSGIKRKNLLICTSSPDRCIRALLRAMPMIRQHIPDAEIHWAYGFKAGVSKGGMEENESEDVRNWVIETKNIIKNTVGFKDLGRMTQSEINQLYSRADLFIYPTKFPEIDCISLTKAMSAGAIPIVPPAGAMLEKMGMEERYQIAEHMIQDSIDTSLGDNEYFNSYVNMIISTLKRERTNDERNQISMYGNKYNWDNIVNEWLKVINN